MSQPISYIARKFIEENIDFVIAKVIETKGSAPRKRGAAMVMTPEGNFYGTVGGGLLEAKTQDLCRMVMETREPITYEFILDEQQQGENALAMGCGGDATVEVEFIDTSNPGNFIEEFKLKSDAYVFGGGHVAYALEPLLRHVDFTVTIVDDRQEYSNPERYPGAKRTIVCEDFDHCFDEIETDDDSGALSLLDVVSEEQDLAERVCDDELCAQLRELIKEALDEREARIITLRYGLDGGEGLTQRETAERCAISRSYVYRRD